jgi:biopolymer transport protein TolQ
MGLAGPVTFLQLSGSFSDVIRHSGAVGTTILIILTVLSVVSWTIMIEKARFFRRARVETGAFLESFKAERSLKRLLGLAAASSVSPEAQLVSSVTALLERGEIRNTGALDKSLEAEMISIIATWESYIQFLATTASISPLLGLFGTVWGIMSSFLSMGVQGSASLFVVGPGIAMALITTIFGLGAAIPAIVGYNYIVRIIRAKEDELASFSSRFRNRVVEKSYEELHTGAPERTREGDLFSTTFESR